MEDSSQSLNICAFYLGKSPSKLGSLLFLSPRLNFPCYLRETNTSRASSNTGNILAATVLLSTGDSDARPSPVSASTGATNNDNVISAGGHGSRAGDALDGQVGDGDTAGWGSDKVTTAIVLLDEDAVPVEGISECLEVRGVIVVTRTLR